MWILRSGNRSEISGTSNCSAGYEQAQELMEARTMHPQ